MSGDNKELISMLWDEWKYRNTLYWQMFFRFGFIVLFVSFVPYVYPRIVSELGRLVIAFPIAGAVLSIFAAWLLDAEATRFSYVGKKLNKFRGDYVGDWFPDDGILWKLRKANIGYGISILFGVVLVVASIASAIVLWKYGIPSAKSA
jgi:hypothetical protein